VQGASANERLLAAARDDNEEVIEEIFENESDFDINYHDGLGYTALHHAAKLGNLSAMEVILTHEECDVDPINRLDKDTPLHLAVRIDDEELRERTVDSLLEAGADTYIRNKNGETALDLARGNKAIEALFQKSRASASVSQDDVASDSDDDGSGSDDD